MTDRMELVQSFDDTVTLGKTLAASGYFKDATSPAQAIVKVLAGRELGIGPIASMSGINIVHGKPSISANITAALVKASTRYDYRVEKHTDAVCSISFHEHGSPIGTSTFTAADAQKAGLTGANWNRYPKAMLFARCITQGARWLCPDIFIGVAVYTSEELEWEAQGDPLEDAHDDSDPEEEPEEDEEESNGSKTDPPTLLKIVNEVTHDRYNAVIHMANTIRKVDPDWAGWPPPDDRAGWNKLYTLLLAYAADHDGESFKNGGGATGNGNATLSKEEADAMTAQAMKEVNDETEALRQQAMDDAAINGPTETEIDPPGQEGD